MPTIDIIYHKYLKFMRIGVKLKKIRESKKITQQEVAHQLDISQKTYSNIESDKTTPSIIQLSKLSVFLDFSLLDFLIKEGINLNQRNKEENKLGLNNMSSKLIEQLELRVSEKEHIIKLLKEKIEYLKK